MTADEKAFLKELKELAGLLVGATGNIQSRTEPGTIEHTRATRAAGMALQLCDKIYARLNGAEMQAEQAQVERLDLAALSNLPMGKEPEPTEIGE